MNSAKATKTSSELQTFIYQRYEDPAVLIHRQRTNAKEGQRNSRKHSRNEAFVTNASSSVNHQEPAETEKVPAANHTSQGARSQICVII